MITVAIVVASRRFLAQITRHQNEVKFMSASLQYSNYSEKATFAIPYEILFSEQRYIDLYLKSCLSDLRSYQELCAVGFHHDSAGYALPHALRNILIICATPYEWKHMIGQRICRRNTDETRLVMLDIWQKLYEFDPVLFSPKLTGPFCQRGCCEEDAMSCGIPLRFGLMIPDGYADYVFPRSSMAAKGLVCELPPIDSGYRGEIHAIISNVSSESQTLLKNTRVGQLVITPVLIADFVLALGEARDIGAFGSTGE